jgi:DNA-directed RNA polymerase I, II, and III subunit RPABC2
MNQHPESLIHNYEEIYALSQVQRNKENIIIDGFHRTIPILTKYEKAKILGLRAKQLNGGAKAFVTFKTNIIDGYLIALKELEEKKLPFIIRRPIPGGASEYWNVKDLELI